MTTPGKRRLLAAAVAVLWLAGAAGRAGAADLRRYDSKYYTIYTDLGPGVAREAAARMTRMADEYHERTKAFAGVIRQRFPFYLYRSAADYRAAGGIPGSAGVFIVDGDGQSKLMALAGEHITPYTWHTVQHEGFHQFAHAVIGGDIPTWLNEGLAEYFGEALYTGDGFMTGVVPPWRLKRVQAEIADGTFKTAPAIMAVSPRQWRAEMNIANYDQAWSMVHFLVHGDGGRYAGPFAGCIRELSAGKAFDVAWRGTIGSADGFDARWRAYWLAQPPSPTHALYVRATVATLTSFLGRATARRQSFADLAAFVAAADGNTIQVSADDWLPPSLLSGAIEAAHLQPGTDPPDERWSLTPGPVRQPTIGCALADGTRLTGGFVLRNDRVASVTVEVDDLAKVLADAATLRDQGKTEQARLAVQAALRQNFRSPSAADARAFLRTCH